MQREDEPGVISADIWKCFSANSNKGENVMSDRKLLPGKFVWFEHVSRNAQKAQEFYGEVLGWKVKPFPMGDVAYEMILTGDTWDTMIGGYAAPDDDRKPSHWIATASVEDVVAAANAAVANGGKVLDAPSDLPGVGRRARIADPQGAELGLLTDARGDKADSPVMSGGWLWNELHTSEPTKALSFYEKVIGFCHRSMDIGPDEKYHILARDGVDRGGVTGQLPGGAPPHWLPYVAVDDVDAIIARAKKLGARIPAGPEDIPGIGRFGVLEDPTGAALAIMKPLPRERQP
jgi:predicted enzyme related to lactoylglutathione lyase